jgi:hypothetical protein
MTHPEQPEPVAALATSLTALIAESQALRVDVKANERARKRENQINLGVLLMLSLFVFLVLVVAWQNNTIAQQTRDTNARMLSCTVPGGPCYEDGRKRTAQAVGDIYKVSIYMAECSRLRPGVSGPEFDAFLEGCVNDKLTASQAAPRVQPTPTPTASPTSHP